MLWTPPVSTLMPNSPQEFHITIEANDTGEKVSQLLAKGSGLSLQQIKQAMHKGAVWLENSQGIRRIRRADSKIRDGNILHFYYAPEVLATEPPTHLITASKPCFSVVLLWIGFVQNNRCTKREKSLSFEFISDPTCIAIAEEKHHTSIRFKNTLVLFANRKYEF